MALRDRKVSGPFEKRAGNIESKNNRGLFYTFILFLSPSLSTFPLPMVMQMLPSSISPFDLCPWNLKLKLAMFWRAVSLNCALGLYPIAS